MKRYFSLYLLLALTLFVSCKEEQTKSYEELLTALYTPEYATGFTIYSLEGYQSTMIRITNPWQGATGVVMDTYIQRAEEQPPIGFKGQVIKADAQRIVALSTTNIGILELLGREKRVVGVSGLQYVFNPWITDPKNGVKDLGEQIQYETLVSLQPDVVFCYGVADEQKMMTDKLEELGIPYIYSAAYLEGEVLGKSEWLVLFAEIENMREEGTVLFQEIVRNYQDAKALTANIPDEDKPKVMLNTPFNDAWVLPPKKSTTTTLMRDAGAEPFFGEKEVGDVSQIGMEEAFTMLREADFWIGLGHTTKKYSELAPALRAHASEIRPIQLDHLYNNNAITTPGGGSAYYQEGIVRPDLILRDLIEIFYPELQEHELHFYRHIPVE
ncbi:hypothetical protein IX332_001540 [Porphyromonas levii]|uniref:ABC transporter substrate-binding protein n=1 Tax=Porphyromonas levii TaxID=28114 RepID=UPI000367506D|nr:ABC transporter substrate-binding protein [Porphyromonas levii]MBR8704091.1 hypothetical protein [Porphyromonas levii]MBR8730202.1 hypothetical protein [Porphyromonas levii]MBR8774768.1 hypothetical protein [Porphyromonas levii]